MTASDVKDTLDEAVKNNGGNHIQVGIGPDCSAVMALFAFLES